MKRTAVIALIWAIAASLACSDPKPESSRNRPDTAPTPVLIELFTSEGCSSCPPADKLLTELTAKQLIAGVEIVALGEHVDYWNDLGWPDRFSSSAFTRRQSDYQAHVFTDNVVYTPQLVIDGAFEAIGSNARAVRRAIEQASQVPKAQMIVAADRVGSTKMRLDIAIDIDDAVVRGGPADVFVAAVEDGLVTDVPRGENRGRTLTHSAVVRLLEPVRDIGAKESQLSITANIPIGREWKVENLRILAFIQEQQGRRVLGAASTTVTDGSRAQSAD